MYHHLFPPEFLALQQELKNHPEIVAKLAHLDFADSLGQIGADLGIVLDGYYEPVDLCKLLTAKLKERSTLIIRVDEYLDKLVPIQIREGEGKIILESQKKEQK